MIKSNFKPCGNIGPKGDNGITPHIGENGNWYLGNLDTGIKAEGPRGPRGFQGSGGATGPQGLQGPQGPKGDPSNIIGLEVNEEGHLIARFQTID